MHRFALAALLLWPLAVAGGSVTFCDVCGGLTPRFVHYADETLKIYCPNQVAAWMTMPGCKAPKVSVPTAGHFTITCSY